MRNLWDSLKSTVVVAAVLGGIILLVWLLQLLSFENIMAWFGRNWSGMLVGITVYVVVDKLMHRRS